MEINLNLLQRSIYFIYTVYIKKKKLAAELCKEIIRKFEKRKVNSPFIDNISGTDLADIQLISRFNNGFRFLLCVIDIYSRYTRVIPLKDDKIITITNTFQKNLDESNRKPNKLWDDKDSEFYNRSMKSFLQNNDIEIYSTHNEDKNFFAERFIRTLKNKIHKYMVSVSKNVYIDKLDDIVNKYNNLYHSITKMKPVGVKSNTYINTTKEIN